MEALLVHSKHGLVVRDVLTLQLSYKIIGKAAVTSTLYPDIVFSFSISMTVIFYVSLIVVLYMRNALYFSPKVSAF